MSGEREQSLDPVLDVKVTQRDIDDITSTTNPAEKDRKADALVKKVVEQGKKSSKSTEKAVENIKKNPNTPLQNNGDAKLSARYTANIFEIAKVPELLKKLIPGDTDTDQKRRAILSTLVQVEPEIGIYTVLTPLIRDIVEKPDELTLSDGNSLNDFERRFANLAAYDKNAADLFKGAIAPTIANVTNKKREDIITRLNAIQTVAPAIRDSSQNQLTPEQQVARQGGRASLTEEQKKMAEHNNKVKELSKYLEDDVNDFELMMDYIYAEAEALARGDSIDPVTRLPRLTETDVAPLIEKYQERYKDKEAKTQGEGRQRKINSLDSFNEQVQWIKDQRLKHGAAGNINVDEYIQSLVGGAVRENAAEVQDLRGVFYEVDNSEELLELIKGLKPEEILNPSDPNVKGLIDYKVIGEDETGEKKYAKRPSEEMKKVLQNKVARILTLLSEKLATSVAGDNPQEAYNEVVEGSVLRIVRSQLSKLSKSQAILQALDKEGQEEFTRFVNEKLISYLEIRKNYQLLFYIFPFILNKVPPEGWRKQLERYKMSDIWQLVERDPMIDELKDIWKYFIQRRVVENGNFMPYDLGKVQDNYDFQKEVERFLIATGREELVGEASGIAYLVRGIATLTGEEQDIYALTKPMEGSVADQQYRSYVEIVNIQRRYGVQEAFRVIAKHHVVATFMQGMSTHEVNKSWFKEMVAGKLKGYVPKEVYDTASKWYDSVENLTEEEFQAKLSELMSTDGPDSDILNINLLGSDVTWLKMTKRLGLQGLFSRAGYATSGIKRTWSEGHGYWGGDSKNWANIHKWMREEAGLAFSFLYAKDRAGDEADEYLKKMLDLNPDNQTTKGKKKFASYKGDGSNRHEAVMAVRMGNKEGRIKYNQYKELRTNAIRGETYYEMLLKDPLSYLNNMAQLVPELAVGYVKLSKSNKDGSDQFVTAAEFYLSDQIDSKLTAAEKQRRNVVHKQLLHYFHQDNLNHVKEMMDFHTNLYESYTKDGVKTEDDLKEAKKTARKVMQVTLSAAHQKVKDSFDKEKIEQAMKGNPPRDIKRAEAKVMMKDIYDQEYINTLKEKLKKEIERGGSGETLSELIDDLERGKQLGDLLLGGKGLITHFDNYVGERKNFFGNSSNDLGEVGGFFQQTARAYFDLENNQGMPIGDINYKIWFNKNVGWEADAAIPRRWGDFDPVGKIQAAVLTELPGKLKNIANSYQGTDVMAALKDVLEIHGKVKELESIQDNDYGKEMNGLVAYTTARYFQMHYNTRYPIVGALNHLGGGKEISLATMFGDRSSFTMTSDGIRTYLNYLVKNGYIKAKGYLSKEDIEKRLGVEISKFAFLEVIPNTSAVVMIFLLAALIQEGLEEATDKK